MLYANWLWRAHILPVSSEQDFFGGSVVEAIYCGCHPILPNRLAYPEHLPNHPHLFYNNFEEFCEKLENGILNFSDLEPFNIFVEKYDWQKIIGEYDKNLMQTKKP